jgi:hypothetical protein
LPCSGRSPSTDDLSSSPAPPPDRTWIAGEEAGVTMFTGRRCTAPRGSWRRGAGAGSWSGRNGVGVSFRSRFTTSRRGGGVRFIRP